MTPRSSGRLSATAPQRSPSRPCSGSHSVPLGPWQLARHRHPRERGRLSESRHAASHPTPDNPRPALPSNRPARAPQASQSDRDRSSGRERRLSLDRRRAGGRSSLPSPTPASSCTLLPIVRAARRADGRLIAGGDRRRLCEKGGRTSSARLDESDYEERSVC